MHDEHIEDRLFDYFSGRLSEEDKAELLRWIEEDESHKQIFSEMSDWWATAHVPLFASEMRENFATRLSPLLKKQNGSARSLFGNAWFKAAASLLLLISFSVAFYYVGRKTAVQPEEMAWFETVTPYGAQSKVVLPDKSVVWINAGSSLKYNKSFNKINREVYLEGEAYFEVSHDSLKPFIVKSDALDVKVLGTRFNVKAYENDQTVDVCLISGKVDVHFNEEASALPNVIMKPNQLVSYHRSSSTMDLKETKASDASAWIGGKLKFSELSFADISKQLERRFNVKIILKSNSLRKEIFTGSFDNTYSLNEILRKVDVDNKYVWTKTDSTLIIYDRKK